MTDEIIPVHLDRLRAIYFEHLNEFPDKPTIEDWYRFEAAVRAASLVKVRTLTEQEHDDLLLDAALREAANDLGMTVLNLSPLSRKDRN